jgi:hypothetical protein
MKLGLVRRCAAGAAILLGAGTLAACLPGGGDPPPPPWCHPTGIALLEASFADASRLGLDDVVDVILWKLDQCGGGGNPTSGGGSGGDNGGGVDKCELFTRLAEDARDRANENPGNPGLDNAADKAEARRDAACNGSS